MTRPLEHPLTPDADITADEAFPGDLPEDFDVGEAIAPRLLASRRGDGWTAERQRAFCDAVATGATVENAAREVGLSTSSAYAFRNSARGAAFAIGWTAASLIQRQRLSDIVLSRAFCGQTVTVSRASGETVERHFFDNRLTMAVLTRLDRLAAGVASGSAPRGVRGGGQAGGCDPVAASQAQEHAARLAAGEWDRYLDLLANDATPARAGLFFAQRAADAAPGSPELAAITALARADLYDRTRAGIPAELDTSDLDVAHRADWTADQWARAEAAGLLTVAAPAPEPEPETHDSSPPESQHSNDAEDEFWWDYDRHEWRTAFPPPQDFDGDEQGEVDDVNYQRTLTEEEAALMGVGPERYEDWEIAERAAQRDAWFAQLRGEIMPVEPAPLGHPGEGRDRCVTEANPSPHAEPDPTPIRHPGEGRDLPVAKTKPAKKPRAKSKRDTALPTPDPSPPTRVTPAPPSPGVTDMADTSHDIRTLNGLIATTIDSVDGYQEAAKDSENGRFTPMFTSRAQERRKVASDLQAEVTRLGGNPEDDGTILAGAHRAFVNLKSAVTGKDDKAIVNEVERGEDHIKAKFEDAMKDDDLSPETRSAIGAAWGSVKAGHDEMRDLKHSMEG